MMPLAARRLAHCRTSTGPAPRLRARAQPLAITNSLTETAAATSSVTMKVLESQSAVLTNFEVHQHVLEQHQRYKNKSNRQGGKPSRRRGPPNYETVMKELKSWLEMAPNPLSQTPLMYTDDSIPTLLKRLRPFDLSKGEAVMILNLRPNNVVLLNAIIEEMGERFTEEQQEELISIIIDVLGDFPATKEAGDVSMADAEQAAS